jgi:hypothetical protein
LRNLSFLCPLPWPICADEFERSSVVSGGKAKFMSSYKTGTYIFLLGASLVLVPDSLRAQPATTATTTPPSTSPGGGITGSGAPIETTLFAYRALAADSEAVSREIAAIALRKGRKIVIGTATDAASFAQWRAIMGEIILLRKKAENIDGDLNRLRYIPNLSLLPPVLHVIKTHSGSFLLGGSAQYILVVSNDPLGGTTNGTITVTETLPQGVTIRSMAGGAAWRCNTASGTCTTNATLLPGESLDPIQVTVNIANNAPQGAVTNSAVVSGGGSLAASATDTVIIGQGARQPLGRERALTEPTPTTPTPTPTSTSSTFSTATGALPAFVQLATFLAQAFAVNQTLSPSQGNMTDLPLMNMVARHLREAQVDVVIPSVYGPNLLKGGDLNQTYIWRELTSLETAHAALWRDIGIYSQFLNHANFVTLNSAKYSREDVQQALLFAGKAQSYLNTAQAVAASIDSFEASLFGGTAPAANSPSAANGTTPAGGANPSGSTTPSGTTPTTGTTTPSAAAPGATTPANPAASNTANTPAGTQTTAQTPANATFAAGQGNVLPQILGSDLLAQYLWDGAPLTADFDEVTDKVDFLAVHALESGGSQLNKSNIFYGVHIFFSGGAVMTFSLYEAKGGVACSGFAYAYRGNVREKNYERVLHSGSAHDAILNTDFACPNGPPASAVAVGMSRNHVINILGPPDSKHFGTYRYIDRRLVIRFEKDRVSQIQSE